MELLTLEDFLDTQLNEIRMREFITQEDLDNTSIFEPMSTEKILTRSGLKFQAYIKMPHFDTQYKSRFITGEGYVENKTRNFKIKFKDLPGWESRDKEYFKKKLLEGLNKIITDYSLKQGGYHIISESSRMVIPIALLEVKNMNKRVAITSSIFHTSMTNLDVCKWKNRSYDKDDVLIEYRSYDRFLQHVEKTPGLYMIEGIDVELFHENDTVYTNTPIIIID